jgi:hypothetical protein
VLDSKDVVWLVAGSANKNHVKESCMQLAELTRPPGCINLDFEVVSNIWQK